MPPIPRVDIVLVRDRVHRAALDAAVAAGVVVRQASEICAAIDDYSLVLDGILGIGRLADRRMRSARAIVECLLAPPPPSAHRRGRPPERTRSR